MIWVVLGYFVICISSFFSGMWLVRNYYVSSNVIAIFFAALTPFVNLLMIGSFIDKMLSEYSTDDIIKEIPWLKSLDNWFKGGEK